MMTWDLIELIAQALTAMLIWMSVRLLTWFGKSAAAGLKKPPGKRNQSERLIIGIFIGFAGGLFDNLYWFVAWTADFLSLPSRDELFAWGIAPNLFFRELSAIIAIVLHVSADDERHATRILREGLIVGFIAAACLVAARGSIERSALEDHRPDEVERPAMLPAERDDGAEMRKRQSIY